jgi:hypothetical protein
VQKRQADSTFVKEVAGRQNDGQAIQLQLKVSLTPVGGSYFFLIEVKSMNEVYALDEKVSQAREEAAALLATGMPRTSGPGALFDQSWEGGSVMASDVYAQQHYECGVICLLVRRGDDGDAPISWKTGCESIIELYSGVSGGFVLDGSCRHVAVLFPSVGGEMPNDPLEIPFNQAYNLY